MLLNGNTESGHSYKVRLFLLLAGINHIYRSVDLEIARAARPADFVAASKFGEVPVLVCEGTNYCQSNAILAFLAQRFRRYQGRPDEWHLVLEWLSWETNRIGFSVPNLRHARRWEPQPREVLGFLEQRAAFDLSTLDKLLSQSEFLLPSGMSIADLSCAAYLYWIDQAGLSLDGFPHVNRWLKSISAADGWEHPTSAMRNET